MAVTFFLTQCPGLQTSVQAGDTVGNTTTATNFASTYGLPAGALNVVGRRIRPQIWGLYSTDAVFGHAITLDLLAGSTVVLTTGSVSLTLGGAGNKGWMIVGDLACRSTGAAGTVEAQGLALFAGSGLVPDAAFMTNTGTIQWDLTQGVTFQVRATWGTASASNTITMRERAEEIMGTS
jgi:hypothetical protein